MYPSEKDKTYGTFVKMFKEGIEHNTNDIIFYFTIIYKTLFTKYDFIYNHQITHSAPALRFCRYFRTFKLVMNIHGGDIVTIDNTSEKLLSLAIPLLVNANLIVVPSEYFKNIVLNKVSGISVNQLFVSASGGVDRNVFTCLNNHINSTGIILYVSRIDTGKGWDVLLNAVSELKLKG